MSDSIIVRTGDRYGVDPNKLLSTMRATCFKQQAKPGERPVEVSNEQMMALLVVAEQYKLNPFTKEIYAFADKGGIVPVVGVDGWARLANESGLLNGVTFEVGPIGTYQAMRQTWGEKKGERVLKGTDVTGPEYVTCRVYRKDMEHPVEVTEYLTECWRNTDPWNTSPQRMLRHRAMVQAYRVAFGFAGFHDEDEALRIVESRASQEPPPLALESATQRDRLSARLNIQRPVEAPAEPVLVERDPDTGEVIPDDVGVVVPDEVF